MASQPEPGPRWLATLRDSGRARFAALGLPTRRLESWRYFPLRALRGVDFDAPAAAASIASPVAVAVDAARVAALRLPGTVACAVFVDGRFAPTLSDLAALPAGVHVSGLAAALDRDPETVRAHLGQVATGGLTEADALIAANAGRFADGLYVDVPAGVAVVGAVQALFLTSDSPPPAVQPRNVVVLGRSAELALVLRWAGPADPADAAYAVNAVSELVLADNATLRVAVLEDEGAAALHVHHIGARVAADATLSTFTLSLGGDSARTAIRAELAGRGASANLDGLYLAGGQQRLDHYVEVDHVAPHTTSATYYAGILDDASVGTFQGVVFIRPGASKANAGQLNKNLLLSPDATANTKPQLEIDHDDVKASHGSTVGQLNAQALFYLLSRGLAPDAARGLLTFAFAKDALARLGAGPLADALVAKVATKLGADPEAATGLSGLGDDDDDDAGGLP